jgi:hypothetical protein
MYVNKQPLMKTYDYLKKRNIVCWGIVFFAILDILLSTMVTALYTLRWINYDTPQPNDYSTFSAQTVLILSAVISFNLSFILIIVLVLAIPTFYNREKVSMLCRFTTL